MKALLVGGIFMLFANTAIAGDVFEIVSTKFKEGTPIEKQKKAMAKLNAVVKEFEGFKSRDYYYSADNGRWVDFVVWSDQELAVKASELAMNDPKAGEVFSLMDENTMIFSHYEIMGGTTR